MSRLSLRPWFLLPGLWLLVSGASAGVALGLEPLIALWGGGDRERALVVMQELAQAHAIALRSTEMDAPTERFVEQTLEALEDFDLHAFYETLPIDEGRTRTLALRGELLPRAYRVSRAGRASSERVGLRGPRTELLAMSMTLSAREQEPRDEERGRSFLLGYQLGLGIGPFRSDRALEGLTSLGRIVAPGETPVAQAAPAPIEAALAGRWRALHPRLRDEDLESVLPLVEAFPQLAMLLSQLIRLEDVRKSTEDPRYEEISLSFRLDVERLGKRYGELARYFAQLGELMKLELRWIDSRGRTLLRASIDTERLTGSFRAYVRDGRLLPQRGKQVFVDEPLRAESETIARSTLAAHVRCKLRGVEITLPNLRLASRYAPHGSYAELGLRLSELPSVQVAGRALGFLPTGLVDAFIPGDIASITRDFFTVLAHGQGGRGLTVEAQIGTAEPDSAAGVFELDLQAELLDSFLVKLGVGMVNDRIIPGDEVVAESRRFGLAANAALLADLARHARPESP